MQNSAVKAIWKSDRALVAQLVERVLGKDEVTGSSPVIGSRYLFKSFLRARTQSGSREAGSL